MPRPKPIADVDDFLLRALHLFHSAQWRRAATMFKELHEDIRSYGVVPSDWQWKLKLQHQDELRKQVDIVSRYMFLRGLTGVDHTEKCVATHDPRLFCADHPSPDCVERDCQRAATSMSEEQPRCAVHYREWADRTSKMMGYGLGGGNWTGD